MTTSINQAQLDGVVLGLKGVPGANGAPVPRLDIDVLMLQYPDTFNLFCLALIQLQKDTSNTGYFQVAGIHGCPKSLWDNVAGPPNKLSFSTVEGYCNHGSPTFGPWHRPYLSMIEQTIYNTMLQIAGTFPSANQSTYKAAVQQFRLPYWDYYRVRGTNASYSLPNGHTVKYPYDFSIPKILTEPNIMLKQPSNNALVSYPNPLLCYHFPTTGGLSSNDWRLAAQYNESQTLRYPTFAGRAVPTSTSTAMLDAAINAARPNNADYILHMMTSYTSWSDFGDSSLDQGPYGSLEDIHGTYHITIGGAGGHMQSIAVAAFDPIFWIHHCQIDRFLAIWQAIHSTAWFAQGTDQGNLLPFRTQKTPQTSFWTSATSRDTKSFGYTYPDILQPNVLSAFVNHYSWATSSTPTGGPPPDMQPLNVSTAQVFQFQSAVPQIQNLVSSKLASFQQPLKAGEHPLEEKVFTANPKAGQHGKATPMLVDQKAVAQGRAITGNEGGKVSASVTAPADETPPVQDQAVAQSNGEPNGSAASTEATATTAAPSSVKEIDTHHTWFTDVIVERMALNGTFTIYFFLGSPPPDRCHADEYLIYPTLAGVSHFMAASIEFCDNCGNQQLRGHLVTSTTPITSNLREFVEKGELADLSAGSVKPFLVKNLKWRVVKENGDRVDPRVIDSLKLGVSCKTTPAAGQGEPSYERYPDVIQDIIEYSS